MKMKIIISTIIAFYIGYLLSPPDIVTGLFNGIVAAFICCLTLLILARFKFVKSSPNSMHTLVCILVCMVSSLSVQVWLLYNSIAFYVNPFPNSSVVVSSFSPSASYTCFGIGNLWIVHSTNLGEGSYKETEYIIFSVDLPKTYSFDGSTWMFAFSDDISTGFSTTNRDKTVWIDKDHRLEFLGPVLNKEDVLLLRNHRHDEEFKISSPEELLTIVNKLKAEHVDSRDPQKNALPNNVKLSGE